MSAVIYTPDAPLQHSAPAGWVTAVSGAHGVVARETDGAIEWTSFDRRPPGSTPQRQRPVAARARVSHHDAERRRTELAAQRRAHPDLRIIGRCVPYGATLPGNRGGERLVFDSLTQWALDDPYVKLEVEHHGPFLGVGKIIEEDAGLYIDGVVYAPRVKALDGRHELSIALSGLETERRRDGVLVVRSARLDEVSLCRHAAWAPYTDAAVVPVAA